MELPGVGLVRGHAGGNWDLRAFLDDFLGGIDFRGKRVLEIGPASGMLTFEMERRGAQVVCVEIPADHEYDVVPYPGTVEMWREGVRQAWEPMTNAWWYAHECLKSSAKVIYLSAYDVDRHDIGEYDICIIANVLLHNRDPFKILQNCARITRGTMVVVDLWNSALNELDEPLLRFAPEPHGGNWNGWWGFSTRFIANALAVMGFHEAGVNTFRPLLNGSPVESFRLIAVRNRNDGPVVGASTRRTAGRRWRRLYGILTRWRSGLSKRRG
jgi:O-methyltransferase